MALTKDKIAALEIGDELKADILSLFGDIESKETEVQNLRKKVPTDSQTVVESVDFTKFQTATTELQKLKDEMAAKLQTRGGEQGESFLSAFSSFFA